VSCAGRRLIESANEALAFAEGRADPGRYGVHLPDEIDVRTIRPKVGMTQAASRVTSVSASGRSKAGSRGTARLCPDGRG
jgi:hypothetical protein